jgi:Pentapeptide repeats (8 copies)
MFSDSKRVTLEDKMVDSDLANVDLKNRLFIRLGAKQKRFTNVDFKYSIFDTCYMRKCAFDSCDFTGCRFIGTSLYGSNFTGCIFDYSMFEKTIVDSELLETGCPGTENLKMRFARTLRMNYQQLGDSKSANKAIGVELAATEVYLHKAWRSNESYYRHKYAGWKRVEMWAEWLGFKILDFVWGNGESAWKLLRAVGILLLIIFGFGLWFGDGQQPGIFGTLTQTPEIFLVTITRSNYPEWYLTSVLLARLIAFGFFMSIIIKRFNRR